MDLDARCDNKEVTCHNIVIFLRLQFSVNIKGPLGACDGSEALHLLAPCICDATEARLITLSIYLLKHSAFISQMHARLVCSVHSFLTTAMSASFSMTSFHANTAMTLSFGAVYLVGH